MSGPQKRSEVEGFKESSRQLRGRLAEEFKSGGAHVDSASKQLLKFHGLYEQDNCDLRPQLRHQGSEKAYDFMVRSRIPGGSLTAAQYLVHDRLASLYGNDTLRVTTRQDIQLHGVLKGDVRASLRSIDRVLLTTFGACGDVVRNVMGCPLPSDDPVRRAIELHVKEIASQLLPRSRAYHELWLDGEQVQRGPATGEAEEPLYGATYLPRKFKIAVAAPGDNCVDVHTQDIGIVAIADGGELRGFNVLAGGGQGMTHNKPETFPRLADPLAFVRPERLLDVVRQIVLVHRDHGDRTDRRHARLKYLIHDRGLEWFRGEVERGIGSRLDPPLPLPALELRLHLGWQRQDAEHWCYGLSLENGRIGDVRSRRLKTALRTIVERLEPGVRLTPHQNLLLTDLRAEQRAEVDAVLLAHGVPGLAQLSNARLYSMACPALPTCGLALAEAERALPTVIDELEVELDRAGLAGCAITVRMTGCPNGCARPYVADIGFVGRSLDRYAVLLGGRSDGSRLNKIYADLVPRASLVATLRPLLWFYRDARQRGEGFGDFCERQGIEALRSHAAGAREAHA